MIDKKFALVAALILGFAAGAAAVPFGTHDYLVVSAPNITWDAAQAAVLPGYHLATVSSAAENAFIRDLINAEIGGEEYWLGGSQPAASGAGDDWEWENGEGVFFDGGAPVGGAYTNWVAGEPNGDGNHLAMWADDNRFGFTAGFWNDEGNLTWIDGYVIETPEPGTLAMLGLGLVGLVGLRRRKRATAA